MGAPLDGVRVVVAGHALQLASASMMLGDLGADVVLVEDPDAPDPFEQAGPVIDGLGYQRLAFGRNKRSVALRLSREADRDIFARLLQSTDVLLYDSAAADGAALTSMLRVAVAARPQLIACNGAAWGSFGARAGQAGHDLDMQAAGGSMDLTGEANDPPTRAGIPLFDLVTGTYIAIAVIAALVGRQASGRGERIEVAGFDTAVVLLSNMASAYLATGEHRSRLGTGHISIFPYNAFRTSDGEIVIAIFTQAFWTKFCEGIGLPELLENPRYRSIPDRMLAKDELSAILEKMFLTRTTDEWAAVLETADVPYGPVLSVGRALSLPQTLERGMVTPLTGLSTPMQTVGSPIGFHYADGSIYRPPAHRAPLPGEHDPARILRGWAEIGQEEHA
jgi:crotonobetainyl-CoA:carnitine CoA-transferase CaiB-like acyl-CoA transferase